MSRRVPPSEADFDDMHHALGRPAGPHVEPYRNRYICAVEGPQARRFEALGLWRKTGTMNRGEDGIFSLTAEGRAAVMAWLAEKHRAGGLRAWIVHGRGLSTRTVIAKSAGAAKYDVYLSISDIFADGFRAFLRLGVKARPA